ncbi:MAG: hypothetical protein F6K58_08105 [Symploca sp. SIO2E9]|nr:hypothetical protein [Symploca sp. SIO2E9]
MDSIQEGVYFRSKERPDDFLRLVFLNFSPETTRTQAHDALLKLWGMLQDLKQGIVRDLRPSQQGDPDYRVPTGKLTVLLGYGRRIFDFHSHANDWISPDDRPYELGLKLPPGENQPFRSLHWGKNVNTEVAQSDLVFQFIAVNELAVNRAVVEVQKLIDDQDLPLSINVFYQGFHREDRRSWIEFHDGINNMVAKERIKAIEYKLLDQPWMTGGTFMAFFKIEVDLKAWRKLSRIEQEILVGRNKLTGCPLDSADVVGDCLSKTEISGCPMTGSIPNNAPNSFLNPPRSADSLIQSSHIHRSNLNRGNPGQDSNNRIFRQGYEFLDWVEGKGISVGLNFISFQRRIKAVRDIIGDPDWMGGVNFGGPEGEVKRPPAIELMSLISAGFYAIPPKLEPYPGASLFNGKSI